MTTIFRNAARYLSRYAMLLIWIAGGSIFCVHYTQFPAVPGNDSANPLGWWGWADQGLYLLASKNFLSGPIEGASQFYPPLYSLVGAVFVSISEMHGYSILNFLLFMIYLWAYMRVFSPYIGNILAMFAIILGVFWYQIISLQWVVPWTSTLAAVLQLLALVLFQKFLENRRNPVWFPRARIVNAILFATCVGLLAPTRPVELVVFSPLLIAYAVMVLRDGIVGDIGVSTRLSTLIIFFGVIFVTLPVLSYLLFNTWLFGAPLNGYFAVAKGSGGATLSDTIDRAYSHLVDANTFYAEPSADWMSTLPLFLFCLCFLPFALLWAPIIWRLLTISILLHFFFVYSFADAVPTGQFRYFNIHYFKWMYPILPFITIFTLFRLVKSNANEKAIISISLVGVAGLLIGALSIAPSYSVHHAKTVNIDVDGQIIIDFPESIRADFFDFQGPSIAFGHFDVRMPRVRLDNSAYLTPIKESRLTPRPGGIRYLLIDSHNLTRVILNPKGISLPKNADDWKILAAGVHYSWVLPWTRSDSLPQWQPNRLHLGKVYKAGDTFNREVFLRSGWSHVEQWGCWIDGPYAQITFALPSGDLPPLQLDIVGDPFLSATKQSKVLVDVMFNSEPIGTMAWDLGETTKSFSLHLPQDMVSGGAPVQLAFRPHTTISPKEAGYNADTRELSFGLISFAITPVSSINK